MEEISGEISVKSDLDYERRTSYDLLAIPVDGSQAIHVYVHVIDENDNSPTFPVPSINVSEISLSLIIVDSISFLVHMSGRSTFDMRLHDPFSLYFFLEEIRSLETCQ